MREEEQDYYRERLVGLQTRLTDEARKAADRVADKSGTPDQLSDVPTHAADRDSEGLDREIALESTREDMLEAIQRALDRLDDGSYGLCEDCGQAIPTVRLEMLPFASRCVACEEQREGE
jgi:DnaK suppressor protein